ncbi:PREDICTED: uncharacterized protein LOC105556645 [Vollenhovia emeryi]|uniref:uncharacterized protein LOC105556645 n=1 Tax=Vollenhovia emeryi TaxID=411798 RepID=UPI0005F4DAA8|nr:PREDICTED: uncharacterized protein LOC105556645 [Vollenhovia emeryi]
MALDYLAWEMILLEERAHRLERRVERRLLRDAQNPFELPRDEFIDYFRLTPELVIQITNVIRADLQNIRITGIMPETKVTLKQN